jgi:hypothetical protein
VRAWLAGDRKLPLETRNYVAAVTGVAVDEWATAGTRKQPAVRTVFAQELAKRGLASKMDQAYAAELAELEPQAKSA